MTVVNSNTPALQAQNALQHTQRDLSLAMEQLSTGQRIQSASDDAAGLAIGSRMTSQIRGLNQAVRNANDGISMMQSADGASSMMTSMLVRMRELSIQASNDTNSGDDRIALNLEFSQLQTEIGRVLDNTQWNGMKILSADAGIKNYHVGPAQNDTVAIVFEDLKTGDLLAATALTKANDATSLGTIDKALTQIDKSRSTWGASINRLQYAADNAVNVSMNQSTSRSRIVDTNYAQATADLARAQILNQAGTAMLSQANQQPMYVLALLL